MSKDLKEGEKKIEISPNELLFFQNMLNNFGSAVDIMQNNYDELSQSKYFTYINHNNNYIIFIHSF
jgi:hypothetical protein